MWTTYGRSCVTRETDSHPTTEQGPLWRPPVEDLCCVNPDCAFQGQRGQGNLKIRKGKGGGAWRILRCTSCAKEFSERKGTPLWGTTMPPERVAAIAKHLLEGCGIRKTSRLVGASKSGVTSVALRIGWHAYALHDERARGLTVNEAQADEKWSFVEKKQKHCAEDNEMDAMAGDQWDHTVVDVESRFVVSVDVGKRTSERLADVVADFAERTGGAPPR